MEEGEAVQISFFDDDERRNKTARLERCVDRIRGQYGHFSIQRAVLCAERLKSVNANNDIGDAQIFYSYR